MATAAAALHAVSSLLAESGGAENKTPSPVLLGVGTFVGFLVILFIVTRLNKDR
jgi:hypothetical protein